MTTNGWITLAVLAAVLVALFGRRLGPAPAMLGGCAALYILGAAPQEVVFGGFSSSAPWVIAGLYVLAGCVQSSGVLTGALRRADNSIGHGRKGMAKLLLPAGLVSAVTANTPVVATLTPPLVAASQRRGISPRGLLMPLSFVTILGGTLTVFGSSTNVAASGLLESSGFAPIGPFDLLVISLPTVIVGFGYIITFAPVMLSGGLHDSHDEQPVAEYHGRIVVHRASTIVGQEPDNLVGELRGAVRESGDNHPYAEGDVLHLTGSIDAMLDVRELASGPGENIAGKRYFEAVVASGSSLIGQQLGSAVVEGRILAFARRIEPERHHHSRPQLLHRGDVVVVLADPSAVRETSTSRDFTFATRLDVDPPKPHLAPLAVGIAAITLVAASFSQIGVLRAVLCGVGALVVTRVVRPRDAFRMVNLEIVVMIAAALGLSGAVVANGLAITAADLLIDAAAHRSAIVATLLILAATIAMTELLTNVAAVAVMIPVAIALAPEADIDPRRLALGVAIAASTSFLTPFGYQTNTMVWRPGRYSLTDYVKFGLPLTIVVLTTLTATITIGS